MGDPVRLQKLNAEIPVILLTLLVGQNLHDFHSHIRPHLYNFGPHFVNPFLKELVIPFCDDFNFLYLLVRKLELVAQFY